MEIRPTKQSVWQADVTDDPRMDDDPNAELDLP
jgi:hypothetical protein